MADAKAILAPSDPILTIVSGPDKGSIYKLVGSKVTLGRAPDNNIVLPDSKSSRYHASVELLEGGYYIKDLGSQNGIIVNGQNVRERKLEVGDQIVVGSTAILYGTPQTQQPVPPTQAQVALKRSSPLVKNANTSPIKPPPSGPPPRRPEAEPMFNNWQSEKPRRTKSQKQNSNIFGLFGIVLLAGLAFIWTSKNLVKRNSAALRDPAAIDQEVEVLSKTNEELRQKISKEGKDSAQYAEAQGLYLKGFREFREGNYARSIQEFNASLAIFPAHPLARKYLEKATIKHQENITSTLSQAERDFQLQKYQAARNAYRTVMNLVIDANNETYKLAKKRKEAIDLILMESK